MSGTVSVWSGLNPGPEVICPANEGLGMTPSGQLAKEISCRESNAQIQLTTPEARPRSEYPQDQEQQQTFPIVWQTNHSVELDEGSA